MASFDGRDLHLVKRALCLSIIVIERQPDGPFKPESDLADLKHLAERVMADDVELSHYLASAQRIIAPPSF